MALGESRQVFQTNIDCTVSGVTERGGILSFVPGVAGLCSYADATAVSGTLSGPAGLLLDDVELLNYFRHPEYRNRNVVPQGSVVGVATEGEFFTDFVETALPSGPSVGTYAAGDRLYLADDGKVSRDDGLGSAGQGSTGNARLEIGRALGTVSADGFLKIKLEV
jgi:hypothetical protein